MLVLLAGPADGGLNKVPTDERVDARVQNVAARVAVTADDVIRQ